MLKEMELRFKVNEQRNLTKRFIEQVNKQHCARCLNEITEFRLKHHRKKFYESGICGECQDDLFWGEK